MKRLILFCLTLPSLCCPPEAWSQNCLERLESVIYYFKSDKAKSLQLADALMADLDSGACPTELGYAETYNNLGAVYLTARRYDRAVYPIKKALELKLAKYDSASLELVDICFNLASAYQYTRNYQEAEAYLQWAVASVRSNFSERDQRYLNAKYRSALFYREVGSLDKSRWDFEEALALANKYFPSNDSIQGSVLTEYGTLLRITGNFQEGESALQKAINLLRGKNEPLHLKAVDRLASLKLDQGEFSESESQLLGNLQLKRDDYPEDSLLMIETLNNLAILYFKINDLESSEAYFNQLSAYAGAQPAMRPFLTNNLGSIYQKRGDYKKAEGYFERSAESLRELYGGIHPDYANVLSNLAGTRMSLGDVNGALNIYMRVLDLDRVIYGPDSPKYATSLSHVALIYRTLGYTDLSERLLNETLEIRKVKLGTRHPLYAKSLNDLGVHFLVKRDTLRALQRFDEALKTEIHHMQSVFPVLTEQQRQLFFENTRFNLERFASLCFSGKFLHSEWAGRAYDYYLNTKSVLFYASDKMRQSMLESSDPMLRNSFIRWRDLKYALAQSYLLSAEERAGRGIDIAQLERQSSDLEKRLALLSSSFSGQNELSFYTWKDLVNNLPTGTVLVEIVEFRDFSIQERKEGLEQGFLDRSKYVAFVLEAGRQELRSIRCRNSEVLGDQFNYYRNALRYGITDRASYGVFWKDIDAALAGKTRVFYAPDGIFHKLNPSVLFDSLAGRFVADKYRLINITSGKDFMLTDSPANRQQVNRAVIFGNPNFASLGLAEPLSPLPEAEREADDVTKILEGNRWKVTDYYYLNATETNLKASNDPGILHLATHGYFNESLEGRNALLNSGIYLARESGSADDGILTAYEAMNLKLDATRLVVLSACETGLGTIRNGEGVFGLQRSFLVAGASHLIISLVKVSDSATKDFMNMFYSELVTSKSLEDSFFDARSSFKKKYPDPYTWGAFVLVKKH